MKRSLYIFGQLTEQDVRWIQDVGESKTLDSNETLIAAGVMPPGLYIVLEGQLSIMRQGDTLNQLATGEIVGDMSLVDTVPPSVRVVAKQPTQLCLLPRHHIEDKIASDTAFAVRFYRALAITLASRLRQQMGTTETGDVLPEDSELGMDVMDVVFEAGRRFSQVAVHFGVNANLK
jgi:CRP/FNR family transcriptional regulator, cyclic AMP receptor protein